MADYTANPTDADLIAFLTAAGVYKAAFASLVVGYAAAAVEKFEELTGRRPFLATSSTTLYFDPQGAYSQTGPFDYRGGEKRLELDVPFTIVTGVALGCNPDDPTGQPIEIGRAVFLKPDRRDIKKLPVEWLEFTFAVWGISQSIGITGTPGSVTEWPADVFNAVLAGAAADFGRDVISASIGKGLSSWKEADTSENYDTDGALSGNIGMWEGRFNRAVSRKRLIRLGL